MSSPLVDAARTLSVAVDRLSFAAPTTHVYNPLDYAWALHAAYLERFGAAPKDAVFVGMNPGPWGMAQTGVPFGEVSAVRDWMGLGGEVRRPAREHPERPIEGLACARSEVSGQRLWGWARAVAGTPERFFARAIVLNYCPLVFMEASGKNRTPDKLPRGEQAPLLAACDAALRAAVLHLRPRIVIGVGAWAESRAAAALAGVDVALGRVLHPSPASPAANRGWAAQATATLAGYGVRF
jgi:single-strand selective monofunctional uracil DNA glycosylase